MSVKECTHHKNKSQKLLRKLCSFFLILAFIVLLTFLITWAILQPRKPRFTLQDATIFSFNVSAPILLSSNFQVTVASHNPNSRIGVYYDKLNIYASYKNQQITYFTGIQPVYQGHHDTNVWSPFVYGTNVPVAPYNGQSLSEDQDNGSINLLIMLNGRVRWRAGLKPNKVIWMSLLSASRIYKKVEIGEYAAQNVTEIDPNFIESYVLLSNMYAATGNWDKVSRVRDAMRKTGVKKDPGCSLIEYRDEVHEFIAGDKSHPRTHEIYHKLSEIRERLKSVGYVPDKSQVLLHIEGDDEKESELESHSERLAIAFGLISLKPGIPIRIVKNLRVCNDCHSVTKHLSQIYDREIIVRDNSRFHHFKHGSCSCMDYW